MNIQRLSLTGALIFFLVVLSASAQAFKIPGPLVDTKWLSANSDKVVLLDVRKDVKSYEKKANSASAVNPCGVVKKKGPIIVSGHIPGATLVPWKKVFTKRKVAGKEIKVLLPDKDTFERLMQKSGVSKDSAVVITSKGEAVVHTSFAARLYWTMKYFGFDNVALLDGGTAQWIKAKNKIEYGKSRAKTGNFQVTAERKSILATTDDVMNVSLGKSNVQLMDARSTAEYLGMVSSGKFVAKGVSGHVASAKSVPVDLFARALGPATVYDKEKFQKAAKLMGLDTTKPTITMCNSGVLASMSWFVLHELQGNQNVQLYDGSMHEWSHTGKPVVAMRFD